MADDAFDIAVIGAGMVGTSCALWLQRSGHRVALIDRTGPGNGTSFGNAGAFATYACVPINDPSIPRRIPELLFSRQSPLSIDWAYAPRMLPWLFRFLRNCSQDRVEAITASLASLVHQAEAGAFPLFKASGADALLHSRGCLYLCENEAAFEKAQGEIALRRANGIELEILSADEVGQLEPHLARIYARGLYYPSPHQYIDPRGAVETMARHFAAGGGEMIETEISDIAKAPDGRLELKARDRTIRSRQMVLAAGAFSRRLFGGLIEPLPLETERGYHVVFPGHDGVINRPLGWTGGGFLMTPMSYGLRAAGTVELGDLSDAKRQANIDYLTRHARRLLPDLPETPESTWVGHRPTLPDSLPVIGRSGRTPEIIFAFGHQHLGMTLGGITGKLVADIVDGTPPSVDLAPFSPARF
ncbi:MAG: NAD(P)/FAD-dependent oxidoreductase [Hyphomicrobiales bacterium]